jgi:hypothetical protein
MVAGTSGARTMVASNVTANTGSAFEPKKPRGDAGVSPADRLLGTDHRPGAISHHFNRWPLLILDTQTLHLVSGGNALPPDLDHNDV